jgi:site-specific recombinase XerD
MQKISFTIGTRTDRTNKRGKKDIFIMLYINGKKFWVKILNIEVLEKNWVKESETAHKREPYSYKINAIISDYREKALKIIHDYTKDDKYITPELFRNELYNKGYDTNFYDYADKIIEAYTNPETKKAYKKQINKLKIFAKTLHFGDITHDFLLRYRKHLLDKGNIESTADKALKSIKVFVNRAMEDDIIKDSPFKKIKFKEHVGKKEALSTDEFKLLYNYFNDNDKLSIKRKETLRAFLFACCTGFRWGDIYDLKFENVVGNRLVLTEHKTQKKRDTPIMPFALQLIDFDKKFSEHQKVFDLPAGQTVNKQLKIFAKDINEKAEKQVISENITFHCSRRTLSTFVYNSTGSIEFAAEIVGNTPEINQKHYSKFSDTKKVDVLTELQTQMFGK